MRERPEQQVKACHKKAARMGFVHRAKNWTGGVKESTMRCCYLGAPGRMKNKSGVYKEAWWSMLKVAMEKYNAQRQILHGSVMLCVQQWV